MSQAAQSIEICFSLGAHSLAALHAHSCGRLAATTHLYKLLRASHVNHCNDSGPLLRLEIVAVDIIHFDALLEQVHNPPLHLLEPGALLARRVPRLQLGPCRTQGAKPIFPLKHAVGVDVGKALATPAQWSVGVSGDSWLCVCSFPAPFAFAARGEE